MRRAVPEDAPFLAVAMQESDRGQTGTGSWDVMFPGPDSGRLTVLEALARASQASYVHWSTFVVGELDGSPAGTVAGYVPGETRPEDFTSACREVLGCEAADRALGRRGAWSREYFTVEIPRDTIRVEWVYTDPGSRSRGASSALITALLDEARARGIATAHVATYIGNEPALRTYRGVGFEDFAECRHRDYEARFGAPGLVFLRRDL